MNGHTTRRLRAATIDLKLSKGAFRRLKRRYNKIPSTARALFMSRLEYSKNNHHITK